MALQRNSKHFFEAVTRLVGPFWGRPRITALLQSYINEVQELEDAAWAVLDARDISTATGVHLDTLGAIVGVPRFTSSDALYRNVIRAKIASNRSKGTTDSLITVVRLAGDVAAQIGIKHLAPATIVITLPETVTDEGAAALAFLLPRTRSAGVRLFLLRPPSTGTGLTWASAVTGGGGDLGSAVSGGGDNLFSVRSL